MRVRPRSRLKMHSGNDLHRWTVSYADYMTLMFAVFVVLFAVSASKEDKYKEVVQSIQDATQLLNQSVFSSDREGILTANSNSIIEDSGPAMLSEGMVNQANNELSDVDTLKAGWELSQLKLELETLFLSELNNEVVQLDLDGDWLTIEMGGQLLFAAGSHSLLASSAELTRKLAAVLKPVDNMLRIRGYTDLDTISNEIYASNWELSGARAFSVLHALNELGIVGQRMVVEAYGEYYPLTDAAGNVDNARSRRVVIAVSKYAFVEPAVNSKNADKNNVTPPALPKADSEEMQEIYLPDNRLIITTRQE
ncbi:flagellar motor protein MotB [Psychromonas ossibalaenae]|uniref:flagellar motor protein MotB n=1 Tax=Psychromonas ossibalaenae TaxID=444922 RepID=UPI000365E205|nr:flagellar motor protein MotB [Psychromonas ossibalaenae]